MRPLLTLSLSALCFLLGSCVADGLEVMPESKTPQEELRSRPDLPEIHLTSADGGFTHVEIRNDATSTFYYRGYVGDGWALVDVEYLKDEEWNSHRTGICGTGLGACCLKPGQSQEQRVGYTRDSPAWRVVLPVWGEGSARWDSVKIKSPPSKTLDPGLLVARAEIRSPMPTVAPVLPTIRYVFASDDTILVEIRNDTERRFSYMGYPEDRGYPVLYTDEFENGLWTGSRNRGCATGTGTCHLEPGESIMSLRGRKWDCIPRRVVLPVWEGTSRAGNVIEITAPSTETLGLW